MLVAGMTGAAAAAVSMMAGTYLDAETARDQARATRTVGSRRSGALRVSTDARAIARRGRHASGPRRIDAVARAHQIPALRTALESKGREEATSPLGHALWMFVSDLLAALVPVLPFALLPIATARYVSIACTAAVLIVLGIGRAKIGKRRLLPTTLQTLGIAAAAGLAGVLVGTLFS
jgi:VIT1/CCC1 family predicted Fe2+/Mn2+ transporter